jgi:hypothetical protein
MSNYVVPVRHSRSSGTCKVSLRWGIASDIGHRKGPDAARHVLAVGLLADPGAGTQGTAIVGGGSQGRGLPIRGPRGWAWCRVAVVGRSHRGGAGDRLVIVGVAVVDVRWPTRPETRWDRYGRRVTAVPALLLFGTAFLILPLSPQLWWLVVVAVVLGAANGMSNGIVMTLGADVSPPHARAEFLAAWRLTHDTGSFAGPLVVGAVAAVSLAGGATAIGVLALVGAGVMYRYIPRYVPVSVAVPADQRAAP